MEKEGGSPAAGGGGGHGHGGGAATKVLENIKRHLVEIGDSK